MLTLSGNASFSGQMIKKSFRKPAFAITAVIIASTSIVAISLDASYYAWLHTQKPDVVPGYYEKIDQYGINGSILISDPVLAAFTDKKLLNYYYLGGKIYLSNEWEAKDKVGAVAYSYNSIACLVEDEQCDRQRKEVLGYFSSNYALAYNSSYYRTQQYIFLPRG